MFDALVDTLMALWNSTWREKVVPTFLAFLVVGVSLFLFFVQIDLFSFSPLSSVSSRSGLQHHSKKSASLAINPHVTSNVHTTAVPTPVRVSNTKDALTPTPIPAPMEAAGNTTYPPAPALIPVAMPGIVSAPGLNASTDIGTTSIASTDTSPAMQENRPRARHNISPTTVAPVPSKVATTRATAPAIATTTVNGTAAPVLPTPTLVATPTSPPPTTLVGGTPTAAMPTSAPTPTTFAPVYPDTPVSKSDSANKITISPDIVATKMERP